MIFIWIDVRLSYKHISFPRIKKGAAYTTVYWVILFYDFPNFPWSHPKYSKSVYDALTLFSH